jgi:predicted nucleotidyltransferase
MRTIGIIAEYDPFHSGHAHQIRALRRAFGPGCAVVCAMSGNFVQRGNAALADKWTRARLALEGGADLILELPTPWAVSSAEPFARGGVALLTAAGVVDTLSFGSEAGDLAPLRQAAQALSSPAFREALRRGLDQGLSFAVARQQALRSLLGDGADAVRHPNNNLGVAYLRAIQDLGSPLAPHTIPRLGAGHDDGTQSTGPHVSASYLRAQILSGSASSLAPYLSPAHQAALAEDPASLTFCTRGVLARLRALSPQDLRPLPDSGEGLENKLLAAAQEAGSLEALYALAKSKRYPHARIRRLVLWAFLGLQGDPRTALPPYLRVLGFSPRGQEVLREMKGKATLPLLTKPAHAKALPPAARAVFQQEARCTALYDLCRKQFGNTPGKNEYTQGPVRI